MSWKLVLSLYYCYYWWSADRAPVLSKMKVFAVSFSVVHWPVLSRLRPKRPSWSRWPRTFHVVEMRLCALLVVALFQIGTAVHWGIVHPLLLNVPTQPRGSRWWRWPWASSVTLMRSNALWGSCNGNLEVGFFRFWERNLSGIFGQG